ncbi:MAG: ABC transporter ATP-binding protein [Eubacteriaceae bacterium]|nr:ABC transporter ATP-binding protein [Eubacteriaceae bacterium]
MNNAEFLIEARDLNKKFKIKTGFKINYINAVENANFGIKKGKTLAVIGESGSGKTTLGRTLLRLTEPDSGKIIYDGKDITKEKMKPYRKKMQIIFQNPSSALDPKMTAKQIIVEALGVHKIAKDKKEQNERIACLLAQMGINNAYADRYPHEFSKGQQQRITIARALAVEPEFIVCDEPTSALDMSIQSQIINLLMKLQQDKDIAYMFISHDLALVKYISDETAVMYMGSIIEKSKSAEIYSNPAHPYTIDLLNSYSQDDKAYNFMHFKSPHHNNGLNKSAGQKGCAYAVKCKYAKDICRQIKPEMLQITADHYCSCHLL